MKNLDEKIMAATIISTGLLFVAFGVASAKYTPPENIKHENNSEMQSSIIAPQIALTPFISPLPVMVGR